MVHFLMADAVARAVSGGAYTGIQNKGAMWISMCIAINYLRCYITSAKSLFAECGVRELDHCHLG